jgi:hypothetical protein
VTLRALWKLGAAIAAATALAACGPEDIELAAPDATATDANTNASTNGSDAFVTALQFDSSVPFCEASAPPPACLPLGDPCGSASDCCSTHCASGACVVPGACAGAGTTCRGRADCCSGSCEPVNGSTQTVCLPVCSPDGTACTRAGDCCTLACNGGVCGGAECQEEGTDCSANAQCCSNLCDATRGNRCAIDPVALCRPSGENCNSGGSGTCCFVCNGSQRCDPGPGPCRVLSAICEQDSDCCHGSCSPDSTGRTVCTAPPLADGMTCQAGFECTSGSCGSDPPACGAALKACVVSGGSCDEGGACCSGLCAGGTCESGCIAALR